MEYNIPQRNELQRQSVSLILDGNSPRFGKLVTQDVPRQIHEEMFQILVGNSTLFGRFLTQYVSRKIREQMLKILLYSGFVGDSRSSN